ncbi:MAG: hypothetical protein IKB99_04650, partial [Lentisphaeria bacterium]|nr:hypothetical protein [Lentisphaeria bacterium]
MDMVVLDNLVLAALDAPVKANFDALYALFTKEEAVPETAAEALDTLWGGILEKLTPEAAVFCFRAAELPLPESELFRKVLVNSATTLLPRYLSRPSIMKAIGVRDEKLPISQIAMRWNKLQMLKSGTVTFLPGTKRWGVIGTIDNISGTVIVNAFSNIGVNSSSPLDIVLKEAVLLNLSSAERDKLVSTTGAVPTSTGFRTIVNRRAIFPVSDDMIAEMAKAGCARNMTPAAFAQYWQAEESGQTGTAAAASNSRRSCNGRSLEEMNKLLLEEAKNNPPRFTDEECELFLKFFTQLKPETAKRNAQLLASVISGVALRTNAEKLTQLVAPLREKALFWPEKPAAASYDVLGIWGALPAKNLEGLANATIVAFDEDYLTECAMVLPLKALNSVCVLLDADQLFYTASHEERCSSDLLMWIWKNRKKHKHAELLSLVNIENVCRALNIIEEPPQVWNVALRELRTSLMDKSDFQQHLLNSCSSVEEFSIVLQGATFLGPRDRQSLLAKMARDSEELRAYLEGGAARKLINANAEKGDSISAPKETAEFTSVLSR